MSFPSSVFKYETLSAQTLRNLKAQVLYFGSPRTFNDPYDCALNPFIKPLSDEHVEEIRHHYLTQERLTDRQRNQFANESTESLRDMLNRSAKKTIDDARADFLNTKGVTCFSEVNDDLLMWSHYGGRYKGICLEFDTSFEPFNRINKVRYLERLPEIDVRSILVTNTFNAVQELFCTKAKAWGYEREWRAMHKVAGTSYTYSAESLRAVYFGPDIDNQSLEIVCLVLGGQNEHVKFYNGARSTTEFKVQFSQFTYTPYLEAKRNGLLTNEGQA